MRPPLVLKIVAYLGKRLHDGLSKPHPGAIGFKGLHSSTIALALRAAMPPLAPSPVLGPTLMQHYVCRHVGARGVALLWHSTVPVST